MNTILWSSQLHNVVRMVKQLDPREIVSSIKNQSFVNSILLSSSEKQIFSNVFSKPTPSVNKEVGYWA